MNVATVFDKKTGNFCKIPMASNYLSKINIHTGYLSNIHVALPSVQPALAAADTHAPQHDALHVRLWLARSAVLHSAAVPGAVDQGEGGAVDRVWIA